LFYIKQHAAWQKKATHFFAIPIIFYSWLLPPKHFNFSIIIKFLVGRREEELRMGE